MIKVAKIFFPKLVHIACMTHAVNSVLEKIRGNCIPPLTMKTWLNAALFYANNFEKFNNVIESLTGDVASVEKLKQLVQNNAVKCGLAFINLHLSELSMNLENFEESNSKLPKSMDIFRKLEDILTNIPGPNGNKN
ncbi:Hypothetical protein CINCED_3A012911 [Cinara cedri]|uniref:DUF659 domain-containing protein n=1 Tax=Cinara cedri TaxID=506608 RepID=A0A5E4MXH4_9HEMI|nr:Hypothetical protein CINCED_3A012911 [Cinara cedri]